MFRSVLTALTFCALLAVVLSSSAFAHSGQLLSFQGLGDLQPVGDFYNGSGLPNTPNYGVTFSSNFIGLRSYANGGNGNFAGTLTGTPAIFINGTVGSAVTGTMNSTPGFSNGLNFYYTAGFTGNQTETVTVWSGANGTGTVLATITLGNNNGSCTNPAYCVWSNVGINFSGTAHSVTFSGPADEIGFSDITLGSNSTAVPEPSTMYLLGFGIFGIAASQARRFLNV
jgi:hypothetical protein